jgi:hypothetical protein
MSTMPKNHKVISLIHNECSFALNTQKEKNNFWISEIQKLFYERTIKIKDIEDIERVQVELNYYKQTQKFIQLRQYDIDSIKNDFYEKIIKILEESEISQEIIYGFDLYDFKQRTMSTLLHQNHKKYDVTFSNIILNIIDKKYRDLIAGITYTFGENERRSDERIFSYGMDKIFQQTNLSDVESERHSLYISDFFTEVTSNIHRIIASGIIN